MVSVVKHSYLSGVTRSAKATAHVNYLQYRSGEDREKEPRKFFDDKKEGILGREVKAELKQDSGKYVHKLILSPGVDGVDMQAYARSILGQLGREKGLDLKWRAVEHNNTDHAHAHVVLFGKDKFGKEVMLRRQDHTHMREFGDRYIERHHEYERFLDKDLHRLMKQPNYEREGDREYKKLLQDLKRDDSASEPKHAAKKWDKEKAIERLPEDQKIRSGKEVYTKYSSLEVLKSYGERLQAGEEARLPMEEYQKLYSWIGTKEKAGEHIYEQKAQEKWERREKKKEKNQERIPGEDEREFNKIAKDAKKSLEQIDHSGNEASFGKGYKQWLRESQGRLGPEHGHYQANEEIQRLKELGEADPSRKADLDEQIEAIKRFDQEQRAENSRWKDLDSMLGDRYGWEQRDLAKLVKARDVPLPMAGQEPSREHEQDGQELTKENEQAKELGKELEQAKGQELKPEAGKWIDLDSMLGERFGRQDYDERISAKEQQRQVGQQQMRQFQDLTTSEAQKPVLEHEGPDRDDSDELFAQGNMR